MVLNYVLISKVQLSPLAVGLDHAANSALVLGYAILLRMEGTILAADLVASEAYHNGRGDRKMQFDTLDVTHIMQCITTCQ